MPHSEIDLFVILFIYRIAPRWLMTSKRSHKDFPYQMVIPSTNKGYVSLRINEYTGKIHQFTESTLVFD